MSEQQQFEQLATARAQCGQEVEPASPGDPLPCPFCGSTDVGGAGGTVGCYRCPAEIAVQNANTAYAVELWNNRVANHPQPAQQGSVPEGWKLVPIEPTQEMRRKAGLTRGADFYTISQVWDAMLSATPQPEGDGWVKCSERLPHISDGDERCSLWVSGLYENTRNRFVMMSFVGEAIDLAQNGAIDHFMPTGLKRPQPPKQEDE